MKDILNLLAKETLICSQLDAIDKKQLKLRGKFELYTGTDIAKNYLLILNYLTKSRIIQKNVAKIEEIFSTMKEHKKHNFKKKILIIHAPICSKSVALLKKNGWKIIDDTI